MWKKSKKKAGRVVRRVLADGTTKEYRYGAYKPRKTKVAPNSLEALINAYQASPRWASLGERSKQGRAAYLRPLEKIGHFDVQQVPRREILIIRDALARTKGPGSANNFVAAVSAMFNWALDNDWIQVNPMVRLLLPLGHLQAWTVEQAEIALRGLPEHLRRAVILGLYTGQRRGDLCAMRWSDYDNRTIRVVQQKTGAEIRLLAHQDLRDELDVWRMSASGETILTNMWGKPMLPNTLSKMLSKALGELGLPPGLNVHGLRKLFAAGMADSGATVHEIAANTGHRTLGMVALYTRSADQQRLSETAVGKIQRFTIARKSKD